MIDCIYRPSGSCSDAFCDNLFDLLKYLSLMSQNFFFYGDFNIPVDTTSKDSVKFLHCLESYNINQHVHKLIQLHEHILDLILTLDDFSDVSNVQVSEFISVHTLVNTKVMSC